MAKDANGYGRNNELLTPKVMEDLETAFQVGAVAEDAAAYAGVSKHTLQYWITQSRKPNPDPLYEEFGRRISTARGRGNVHSLGVLATSDDWRAHRARLAMQRPEYAENRHIHGKISVEHRIVGELGRLSDDELEALQALLAKANGQEVIDGADLLELEEG